MFYTLIPNAEVRHYSDGDGVEVSFYDTNLGEVIGKACTCEYNGRPNAFLHSFVVKAKYRNQGYGTKILEYMLRKYKCSILYIEKTNPAIRLYKRFGFRITGKFNKDFIIMTR